MTTTDEQRLRITQAILMLNGERLFFDTPHSGLVQDHTGHLSDSVCGVIFSALDTPYEREALRLVTSRFPEDIIAAFVSFAPEHKNRGIRELAYYLRALATYRTGVVTSPDKYGPQLLHRVHDMAAHYRQHTGRTDLPGSTSGERLVIEFIQQRPELIEPVWERLTAGQSDQEVVDTFSAAPSSTLARGLL